MTNSAPKKLAQDAISKLASGDMVESGENGSMQEVSSVPQLK